MRRRADPGFEDIPDYSLIDPRVIRVLSNESSRQWSARQLQLQESDAALCRVSSQVRRRPAHVSITLKSALRSFGLSKTYSYNEACRVSLAIVAYFRRHPDAKDNLDGIAQWWVNESRELVEQGLSMLVELGTVRKDHDLYSLADSLKMEHSEAALGRLMEELRQKMSR